jgi:23S rRNA pseudouridine955/2504/2580 synthase
VHCQHLGCSIAGDDKYGDKAFDQTMREKTGLKRLFLHARSVMFILPATGETIEVEAPLDLELEKVCDALRKK